MATPKNTLTAEFVRSILEYEPDTGLLRWRMTKPRAHSAGKIAGRIRGREPKSGERAVIWIEGHLYKAHRVAWLIMTGEWPANEIDHIDRDPSNNRWKNLREATRSQNVINRPGRSKSGHKGVYFKKGGWETWLTANGTFYYLGRYKTAEEAREAHKIASIQYHGEFSCFDHNRPYQLPTAPG